MAAARPLIGAHVPVGGGLARQGLAYAAQIGAEAVQVFVSNPRGWAPAAGKPAQDAAFRDGCAAAGIRAFVHAPYLINFGSPTPATLTHSGDALAHALSRAAAIGAVGVVLHGGSAVAGGTRLRALSQLREAVLPMLDRLPPDGPALLIEPTAGGGEPLAATIDQLAEVFEALESHPALGVCLDTCHAYAAGEDLTARGGVNRVLNHLVASVGKGRLQLVHANESRDPLGSSRDRHESLGAGTLGLRVFQQLVKHPAVRRAAVVVETPSDATGSGHRRDIELLKGFRDAAGR